jgi:hypothetical protein
LRDSSRRVTHIAEVIRIKVSVVITFDAVFYDIRSRMVG